MQDSPDNPQDVRMQQVAEQIGLLEQKLARLQEFLALVPEEHREEVRMALQEAASAMAIFKEIQRTEVFPVDAEGKVILGKALRRHLNEVRAMYSRIDDAGNKMQATFYQPA